MAVTITKDQPFVERISKNLGMLTGTIAFDASYPTNGESVTDITRYFKTCLRVTCDNKSGYAFEWDKTNSKIKVFTQGLTTGATAAADSTSGALLINDAGAEGAFRAMGTAISTTYKLGAMKEVTATTDLSALTGVSFIAIGLV